MTHGRALETGRNSQLSGIEKINAAVRHRRQNRRPDSASIFVLDLCSLFASVHVATIRRLGIAAGVRGALDTVWKLQHALESAGVEFIPEEAGKGPGVRVKPANGSSSK